MRTAALPYRLRVTVEVRVIRVNFLHVRSSPLDNLGCGLPFAGMLARRRVRRRLPLSRSLAQ